MSNRNAEISESIDSLVNAWCDRRCLVALRQILNGYPIASPLTDGWGELRLSLEKVRAFARHEVTEDEIARINRLIGELNMMLDNR